MKRGGLDTSWKACTEPAEVNAQLYSTTDHLTAMVNMAVTF